MTFYVLFKGVVKEKKKKYHDDDFMKKPSLQNFYVRFIVDNDFLFLLREKNFFHISLFSPLSFFSRQLFFSSYVSPLRSSEVKKNS